MTAASLRPGGSLSPFAFDPDQVRRIAGQAVPITVVSLVNMAMSVTDTLMAASFGATALAGVAVASDFYTLAFMLLAGTLGGLSPLYAASSARGEADQMATLRRGGWLILLGGCAILAPLVWLSPQAFGVLGIDPAIVTAGKGYAAVMALTFVPNAVVAMFRGQLVALERPGLILRATLVAVPLNAIGNLVFMFGFGGWDGLGVTGLAVSSLLVWSSIAVFLAIAARRLTPPAPSAQYSLSSARQILAIGLPIGVMTLAEAGIFLGATLYAGTFSPEVAAAHAIAIRLAGISYSVSVGLNQATMVRIARTPVGSGLKVTIHSALALAAGCASFVGLALLMGAYLLSGYGAGLGGLRDAATLAVTPVMLLALMEFAAPIGAASDGVLRARGDTRAAMFFSITGNWLIALPLILLLTRVYDFGVTGLWTGLAAGVLVSAALMSSRLSRHLTSNSIPSDQGSQPC